jgi:predicted O-methyltransferase YrrM
METDHVCNSIVLDSTHCISQLCLICGQIGSDKSVLRTGPYGHKHPYSVPYTLLFETQRNKPIKFLELGVFRGLSLCCWREYFPKAALYGYDIDEDSLQKIPKLPKTTIRNVDVSKRDSLINALTLDTKDGELFDVILDDADHTVESQTLLIHNALPFLKSGGLLIIEDILRGQAETDYESAIRYVIENDLISFYTFIICDHKDRYSPGFDNDKVLVMVRK